MVTLEHKPMATLEHNGHFDASHRLPGFGKCEALHGHTYRVKVRVGGDIGPLGVVMDFGDIKAAYQALDHCNLNEIIAPPTAETIAIHILDTLVHKANSLDNEIYWMRVYLWEGVNNSVEVEWP